MMLLQLLLDVRGLGSEAGLVLPTFIRGLAYSYFLQKSIFNPTQLGFSYLDNIQRSKFEFLLRSWEVQTVSLLHQS